MNRRDPGLCSFSLALVGKGCDQLAIEFIDAEGPGLPELVGQNLRVGGAGGDGHQARAGHRSLAVLAEVSLEFGREVVRAGNIGFGSVVGQFFEPTDILDDVGVVGHRFIHSGFPLACVLVE